MRTPALALIAIVAATACGDARAADADLKSDLELAAATNLELAAQQAGAQHAATETQPEAKPEDARVTRRAPGPRAVRSQAPTVAAAPDEGVAAESEVAQVTEMAEAPAPAQSDADASLPAAARPVPVPIVIVTDGSGMGGGRRGGDGSGTVGTIFGAVIRGGSGVDDDCEIHDARRRRPSGGTNAGPVYTPNPGSGGTYAGRGGYGGTASTGSTGGAPANRPAMGGVGRRSRN